MAYKGAEITYIMGDITKPEGIDAIVNAANTHLARGGGVCGAIYKAAGPELDKATEKLGGCKTGEAKITNAFNIPCKKIVHTPGPVWKGGDHKEEMLLQDSYYNSLRVATRNGMRSVAFPSISTGIFGYPLDKAAKTAVKAITNFIDNNPGKLDKVLWVFSSDDTAKHYISLIEEANKYDDSHSVVKPYEIKATKVDPKDYLYKGKDILYLTTRGVMAYGKYEPDGTKFRVLKGSTICPAETNSCAKTVHAERERLFADGTVVDGVLSKDVVFRGISRACAVISGGLGDGHGLWKNIRGYKEWMLDLPTTILRDKLHDTWDIMSESQKKVTKILSDRMNTYTRDFFKSRTVEELNAHFGGHDDMIVDELVREHMVLLEEYDHEMDVMLGLVRDDIGLGEIDKRIPDRIRGCMIGGAVGDALGYNVEFNSIEDIISKYGNAGITLYDYDKKTGLALISDDTQMSLFTANGIIYDDYFQRNKELYREKYKDLEERPFPQNIICPLWNAYADWKRTQDMIFEDWQEKKGTFQFPLTISWLMDVPELYSRRSPGNTCLQATENIMNGRDFGEFAHNQSKGNGSVMKIAPIALYFQEDDIENIKYHCEKVTRVLHGHYLAWSSAKTLVHIINRIVYPQDLDLDFKGIVNEAISATQDKELKAILKKAVKMSGNKKSDVENITELGGGWVAEEAVAIAVYCSLRYQDDFSAGIIAAVNHSGDSDSTGAITGNILGALLGYDAIDDKWKDRLELKDVILEVAEDLTNGCLAVTKMNDEKLEAWNRKYVYGRWK